MARVEPIVWLQVQRYAMLYCKGTVLISSNTCYRKASQSVDGI